MKRIKIILIILCCIFLCGCDKNSGNLDNAKIYTTVYPIKYIVEYIYGDNSVVESIYPNGVNLDTYSLTDKQIEEYSKGDLFVYIGFDKEKEIAKSFIKKNKNLLIINATDTVTYDYNIKELWLAPNNFLMLAKNIRKTLSEYLDNPLKEDAILKKYNELYSSVSWIDAELRSIAKEASEINNNTLVVSSNSLKFLEHYGFNIVSLEDIIASGSDNALNDIKNKFKNSKYTTIIKLSSDENNSLITELTQNYKANIININDLVTNSDTSSDYLSVQYENVAKIRNLLIK